MDTLIFLIVFFTILFSIIKLIINSIRKKSTINSFKTIVLSLTIYIGLWIFFYLRSSFVNIPLGTDICFDDWCATVTKYENPTIIGKERPNGHFIILNLKISNHARGIAQKPSEPKVTLLDENGNSFSYSKKGQIALENIIGNQISLEQKLELHESLETKLVFDIPKNDKKLVAFIDEGPFITKLLLRGDNQVFQILNIKN